MLTGSCVCHKILHKYLTESYHDVFGARPDMFLDTNTDKLGLEKITNRQRIGIGDVVQIQMVCDLCVGDMVRIGIR